MITTLGINSHFEHPAVVLVRDGRVLFAAEDERFTGIKHGRKYSPYRTYLPVDALYRALADTGTAVEEIHEIAYSYHRWKHLGSLWGCFTGSRMDTFREELSAFTSVVHVRSAMVKGWEIPHRYRAVLDQSLMAKVRYREWPHHLCHAASAFFSSGYSNALVVVADGAGERATTSVYVGHGGSLKRIGGVNLPHSLGITYSMVTRHLGFEAFADEFKVMGLAAYGAPTFREACRQLVALGGNGDYRVDNRLLSSLAEVFGPARASDEPIEQRHMDVARSVQERLEEALESIVVHYQRATGLRRVCLAGGTFLNCVANGRLARLPEVTEIFVPPAAHDAGTALGAAALSAIRLGGPTQVDAAAADLGTSYDDQTLAALCSSSGIAFRTPLEPELTFEVARRLAAGEVGGVFRGRMEFGPRALGHRSILASPIDPGMRDYLNRLKGREGFRPVAPIVTSEAFDAYFDGERNRYMLFTSRARPLAHERAPSAVHVDGTARVQTVWARDDPWLHNLLERFAQDSGVPVLINTSLNVRGKPIVETPADALTCLFTTGMDFLVLGGLLVDKRAHAKSADESLAHQA